MFVTVWRNECVCSALHHLSTLVHKITDSHSSAPVFGLRYFWTFSEMSRTFTEFSEFRESDKSLEHELGSIQRSCLSHVSCWHCGNILDSHTRGGRFKPFYCVQWNTKHWQNFLEMFVLSIINRNGKLSFPCNFLSSFIAYFEHIIEQELCETGK